MTRWKNEGQGPACSLCCSISRTAGRCRKPATIGSMPLELPSQAPLAIEPPLAIARLPLSNERNAHPLVVFWLMGDASVLEGVLIPFISVPPSPSTKNSFSPVSRRQLAIDQPSCCCHVASLDRCRPDRRNDINPHLFRDSDTRFGKLQLAQRQRSVHSCQAGQEQRKRRGAARCSSSPCLAQGLTDFDYWFKAV